MQSLPALSLSLSWQSKKGKASRKSQRMKLKYELHVIIPRGSPINRNTDADIYWYWIIFKLMTAFSQLLFSTQKPPVPCYHVMHVVKTFLIIVLKLGALLQVNSWTQQGKTSLFVAWVVGVFVCWGVLFFLSCRRSRRILYCFSFFFFFFLLLILPAQPQDLILLQFLLLLLLSSSFFFFFFLSTSLFLLQLTWYDHVTQVYS